MQMHVHDQAAFLLHRREYQNTSLIVEIFTRDHGRMSLLARGARARRDVSHFQIANRLQLGWTGRSELKVLTSIESRSLEVPETCMIAVFYLNELLMYLLPKQDAYADLFELYQLTLLQMDTDSLEPLLRKFEYDMLTALGLMPDLGIDCLSGFPVESDVCYHLHPAEGLIKVDEPGGQFYCGQHLQAMLAGDFSSAATLQTAKRVMRSIIDLNLQGRTLQSRTFYQQMIQRNKGKVSK